jgi:hypothetical protein
MVSLKARLMTCPMRAFMNRVSHDQRADRGADDHDELGRLHQDLWRDRRRP